CRRTIVAEEVPKQCAEDVAEERADEITDDAADRASESQTNVQAEPTADRAGDLACYGCDLAVWRHQLRTEIVTESAPERIANASQERGRVEIPEHDAD